MKWQTQPVALGVVVVELWLGQWKQQKVEKSKKQPRMYRFANRYARFISLEEGWHAVLLCIPIPRDALQQLLTLH